MRRNGNLNLAHIFPVPSAPKPEKKIEVNLIVPANKLRTILGLLSHGDRITVLK
jgi:hypothetical protein